jgi:hypothetical protein
MDGGDFLTESRSEDSDEYEGSENRPTRKRKEDEMDEYL